MKTIKVIIKEINAKPYTKLISNDIENLQKIFVGNVEISCWLTDDIVIIANADTASSTTATVTAFNGKKTDVRGKFIIIKMKELFQFTSLSPKEINYCFKLLGNDASSSTTADLSFA